MSYDETFPELAIATDEGLPLAAIPRYELTRPGPEFDPEACFRAKHPGWVEERYGYTAAERVRFPGRDVWLVDGRSNAEVIRDKLRANAPWALEQFERAADKVVAAKKADIEAFVLRNLVERGLASLAAAKEPVLALPAKKESDE